MPRLLRCFLSIFLAVTCVTNNIACHASAPETAAAAHILIDARSARVLSAHNETQRRSIASTTKIMTCLVALEHSALSDTVTVKREQLREGSSMYLTEGEVVTVEQLLYGLMLPSGNDAAECLAAHCGGGDRARFIAWMNEKAASLGMTETAFMNPSGLDEAGHYSCARDMARLASCAMENATFVRLVSTVSATVGTRTMTNHNKLLASCAGCIGLKTGYTGDAGRTLVTCVERDGLRLVAVTLCDGNDWADHTALYDYGFSTYRRAQGAKKGTQYGAVTVAGESVPAVAEESVFYPLAEGETLTLRAELPQTLDAPVRAGEVLGTLVVSCGETEVARVALVSARDVSAPHSGKRPTLAERLWALLSGESGTIKKD